MYVSKYQFNPWLISMAKTTCFTVNGDWLEYYTKAIILQNTGYSIICFLEIKHTSKETNEIRFKQFKIC